jgi:hypothetical protein
MYEMHFNKRLLSDFGSTRIAHGDGGLHELGSMKCICMAYVRLPRALNKMVSQKPGFSDEKRQ